VRATTNATVSRDLGTPPQFIVDPVGLGEKVNDGELEPRSRGFGE
jgi:hypothetical protein